MLTGFLLAALVAAQPAERPAVEHIGAPTLNGQRLPFSNAVRAGDTVYLSGALGIGADGKCRRGLRHRLGRRWIISPRL
jgi:2-iminobutanoate/2-iminopropanoate deaminase